MIDCWWRFKFQSPHVIENNNTSKSGQHQISLHNINRKVMKIITKERNSLNLYYKKMYGNLYVNIDWEKKPVYSRPTPLKKSGNIFRGAGQLNTGQGKVEAFCVL